MRKFGRLGKQSQLLRFFGKIVEVNRFEPALIDERFIRSPFRARHSPIRIAVTSKFQKKRFDWLMEEMGARNWLINLKMAPRIPLR